MNKTIFFLFAFCCLYSCSKSTSTATENSKENKGDSMSYLSKTEENLSSNQNTQKLIATNDDQAAKVWLQDLFKCRNGNQFCFYLEKEEEVCTKRFYEFMIDSEEIYGASALSEEEMPAAKKKYEKKWSGIYPLRKDMEPWLFGRAQDDMENIKSVKIEQIAPLKFRVFVDYDSYKTLNEVTLLQSNDSFLIDYCTTEYID